MGPRGVDQKSYHILFLTLGLKKEEKKKKKPVSRGTAPVKLIIMIESNTYFNYWYIVVGVTILFNGPQGWSVKNYVIFYFLTLG